MSMVTVAAVGGLAMSAYGAYDAHQQAGDMQRAQNRALQNARTDLNGFRSFGHGGIGVEYLNPGQLRLQYGSLAPTNDMLRGFAQNSGAFLGMPLGSDLTNAMRSVETAGAVTPDFGFGDLGRLQSRIGGAGDAAYGQLLEGMRTGFQRPLQNTAFRGAGMQLQDAMMGGDAARARQLDLLRAQAQPFENRAFEGLQQNLFNTGRLGSTGGALQTEAFARGLGQADLDRQLAAANEGRAFQQNAFGLASGMNSMGLGLSQQENALLNDAFGRFRDTSALGADLNRERFSRSMYQADFGFNRARDILGLRTQMAQLPLQMDALRLQNVTGALQGQAGIQDQLMQLFQAGLSAEQSAANARVGSGSNMASIVGSPTFGLGGMMQAGNISQLGQSLMGGQSGGQILQGLFGRIGNHGIQSPDAWGALNSALASGQVG